MGIFEYALRDDVRCPSWYESEIAPVQCREKKGHDGPHEFAANSLYAVWTDEIAMSDEVRTETLVDETKTETTHKERLMALLDEAGVGYKLKDSRVVDNAGYEKEDGPTLKIKEGYDKVSGYYDFYCEFHFDEDGNLTGAGCWE